MSNIDDIIKAGLDETGQVLTLREKFLGVRGIMKLAQNPALKNIKKLILPSNQTSDEGAEALAQSPYLENLEHKSSEITNEQAKDEIVLRAFDGCQIKI